MNYDLKSLSEWLKSNRLSLNVGKTKLLIFRSKNNKTPLNNISIKIQGVKIIPSTHVKYLRVYVDEYLSWNYHIKELSNKLSRANGIISKLRHYAPKSTIISVYYAIFYSHLVYGSSVWSLTSKGNIDIINILQKNSIRLINFAPFNSHTLTLFNDDELLKFEDIITINKLKFAFDFINNKLPDDFCDMFQFGKDIHDHENRSIAKNGLFVPRVHSSTNRITTLKYSVPVTWNSFSMLNPKLCQEKNHKKMRFCKVKNHKQLKFSDLKSQNQLKIFLKRYYISIYNDESKL